MSCQRLALAFVVAATLAPAVRAAEFEAHVFKGPAGKTLPYRLLRPADYDKARHYPLVLLLHGFGDRGTDNEKQLNSKSNGTALFVDEKNRSKFPCFVVAPQTPSVWVSEPDFNVNTPFRKEPAEALMLTALLLEAMIKEFSVDKDRIYLMGYSNGGCGVWDMLVRAPTKVAAAVIKSGAGDPAAIAVAKKVPTWMFHGEKDTTVPIARARDMVTALKKAGGQPLLTEYPSSDHHGTPIKAHQEKNLLPWMFAQRRGKPAVALAEIKSAKED